MFWLESADCYANENVPLPVVRPLRQLGYDLLTTYESGKAGQAMSDEALLAFAISESRIVFTLNRRHFIRLHHLMHLCSRVFGASQTDVTVTKGDVRKECQPDLCRNAR